MLNINISTPTSIINKLKKSFKQRRLFLKLTQEGLSSRSGVSLGSLKRFESSGQISLDSLLKLALVLECLDDFTNIASSIENKKNINSIDDVINYKKNSIKKRGTIK